MKLDFQIKVDGKPTHPRWHKVEVEHNLCPECQQVMVVISGHNGILYAVCTRCHEYFLP